MVAPVYNKSRPMPAWLRTENESCDRGYLRAVWFAQPIWVDRQALREIYATARRRGHVVDHIVPLRGNGVCGLHVPWNLAVIPFADNASKGNRHWPDMPNFQNNLFGYSAIQLTML